MRAMSMSKLMSMSRLSQCYLEQAKGYENVSAFLVATQHPAPATRICLKPFHRQLTTVVTAADSRNIRQTSPTVLPRPEDDA